MIDQDSSSKINLPVPYQVMIVPPKGAIHFTSQHGKVKDGVLTPGTYDLVWVGKKQGFKIKELSIKGSEQININVEHKTSSDEFSLKELFLKCVPKEEKK